MILSSLPTLG